MVAWTLEEYRTQAGNSCIRHFIEGLTNRQDRKEAAALIKILHERGNLLREPLSESLGEGLFELRGDQVRICYAFRPGRRIVLLDGIVKKRGRLPVEFVRRVRTMNQRTT
jgi:hypothetical protein